MRKQKDDYIRIRIEKDLKDIYLKLCNNKGYSLSKRIRLFIESEIKNG